MVVVKDGLIYNEVIDNHFQLDSVIDDYARNQEGNMNSNPSLHTFGSSAFVQTRDGRKLHYMSRGTGELMVVFESGMGASRSNWGLVAPAIAEHARAVVYDRAGAGRSDVDSAPRSLERIAGDLGELLTALGPGPFILVGHSWGGPIVRAAAAAHLSRLRGIILVDPSDEHCEMYFSKLTKRALPSMVLLFQSWRGLAYIRNLAAKLEVFSLTMWQRITSRRISLYGQPARCLQKAKHFWMTWQRCWNILRLWVIWKLA